MSDVLPFPPSAAPSSKPTRVGLLAGKGDFPVAFARAAAADGHDVYCMGIAGLAPPELADLCHDYKTGPVARMGKAIRYFKRNDVDRVVMAGKIEKRVLFGPGGMFGLMPDYRTLHAFFKFAANRKDDTLLLAVIREFGRDGIQFDSALDYAPELLVNHGFLTRRQPTAAQWRDIRFGWEMAKEMGRLDIGQTVIVRDLAAIAIEAIEGTDEAIRRAGTLCTRGGLTVVKVAKPQQDMRFDVPTIGLDTIQTMRESGCRVLAVEANRTILLNRPEVVALADKIGVTIVSLNADEVQLKVAS